MNVVPLPLPHGRPAVRMPADQKSAAWWAAGHRHCNLSVEWPSVPCGSESSVVGMTVGVIAWTVLQVEMGRRDSGQCASYVDGDVPLTSGVSSENRWRFSIKWGCLMWTAGSFSKRRKGRAAGGSCVLQKRQAMNEYCTSLVAAVPTGCSSCSS